MFHTPSLAKSPSHSDSKTDGTPPPPSPSHTALSAPSTPKASDKVAVMGKAPLAPNPNQTTIEKAFGDKPLAATLLKDVDIDAGRMDKAVDISGNVSLTNADSPLRTSTEMGQGYYKPQDALGQGKTDQLMKKPAMTIMLEFLNARTEAEVGAIQGLVERKMLEFSEGGLIGMGVDDEVAGDIGSEMLSNNDFADGYDKAGRYRPDGVDINDKADLESAYKRTVTALETASEGRETTQLTKQKGSLARSIIALAKNEALQTARHPDNVSALQDDATYFHDTHGVEVRAFNAPPLVLGGDKMVSPSGLCSGTVDTLIKSVETGGTLEDGIRAMESIPEKIEGHYNYLTGPRDQLNAADMHYWNQQANEAKELNQELSDLHYLQLASASHDAFYQDLGLTVEETQTHGSIGDTLDHLLPDSDDAPDDHFVQIKADIQTEKHVALFGAKDGEYFFWDYNIGLMTSDDASEIKAAMQEWMNDESYSDIETTKLSK